MANITVAGVTYELPDESMANKTTLYTAALQALATQLEFVSGSVGARVYNNANLAVANNTITTLTFNSERYDYTTPLHSTSSNTDRLTFPYAGKWRVGTCAKFAANATGVRGLLIYKNGTEIIGYSLTANAGGTYPSILTATADWSFAANDYATAKAFQTSGGSLNVEVDR